MNKAFRMLLAWLFWLVTGVAIGTVFYNIYLHSLGLIAGRTSPVFTKQNMILSFFVISQFIVFILGFLLISFKIRHKGNFLQLIAFIIAQVLTYCVVFPLSHHFEDKYIDKYKLDDISTELTELSPGYFRETDGNIYYFLNDENSSAVKIDLSDEGDSEMAVSDWIGFSTLTRNAIPYKDILIKNSFQAKNSTYSLFGTLRQVAKIDLFHGWTYWLGFLSMALALSSIYALSNLTSWRLANYTICGLIYGLILFWNGFFWSHQLTSFRNLNFISSGPFGILKNWVSSPFLVFTNILLALIMIVYGIISSILKKKRGRRA